jgi:tRNA(Ile)-lysidine synthase
MRSLLNNLHRQLAPFSNAPRWLVAYSGGVDSHVLLHLLTKIPAHPPIVALHINHQLQHQSSQWAGHCQQQAGTLGIPLSVVCVDVECQARESLEEKARQARYQVFESLLEPGDVLLLGHHRDDQVETLLMRLLRGSGSRGVAAMPYSRNLGHGQLLRPLLDVSRSTIAAYAIANHLQWIEDPSNQNSDFDRNFLRLEVLPKLAQRWPEYRQTLSRAAALSEESAQLNAELAELDFHALCLSPDALSIPLATLAELSVARQKNLLRYWLEWRGLPLPSAAQLQQLLDTVVNARPDAEPLLEWPGTQIRRFKGDLYAMRPLPKFDSAAIYAWDLSRPLMIDGAGILEAKTVLGSGLHLAALDQAKITVRFRRGGERCQPAGRSGGSQTLKKLLQEYEVPTWLRDRLPLVYCDDQLVMVANLWVCEGYQATSGQSGVQLLWKFGCHES